MAFLVLLTVMQTLGEDKAMSLNRERRDRIKKRIEILEIQLEHLEDALTNNVSAGGGHVKEYSFNSGEGTQRTVYRRIDEVMDARDRVESQLERLYRIIGGRGIVSINVRRKN